MKNAAGTSFDCAACVSVSQISARERWTTGLGTGGSGGGAFAKSAGWLSGVAHTAIEREHREFRGVTRAVFLARAFVAVAGCGVGGLFFDDRGAGKIRERKFRIGTERAGQRRQAQTGRHKQMPHCCLGPRNFGRDGTRERAGWIEKRESPFVHSACAVQSRPIWGSKSSISRAERRRRCGVGSKIQINSNRNRPVMRFLPFLAILIVGAGTLLLGVDLMTLPQKPVAQLTRRTEQIGAARGRSARGKYRRQLQPAVDAALSGEPGRRQGRARGLSAK